MVRGVLLRNSSIMSQDQSFIYFLYIFVINSKLLDWAIGWAHGLGYWASPPDDHGHKKLAHGLTHWASGPPMGLNNNELGLPLARLAIELLGQGMGHRLFGDPYSYHTLLIFWAHGHYLYQNQWWTLFARNHWSL